MLENVPTDPVKRNYSLSNDALYLGTLIEEILKEMRFIKSHLNDLDARRDYD